jgi:hypothetical protein
MSGGEVTLSYGSAGYRPFPLRTLWARVGLRAQKGRDAAYAEWALKRPDKPHTASHAATSSRPPATAFW